MLSLSLTIFLALLVSWALVTPFFASGNDRSPLGQAETAQKFAELRQKKEEIFSALEDLEQDLASARVTKESYSATRVELLEEAALCTTALDSLRQQRKAKGQVVKGTSTK